MRDLILSVGFHLFPLGLAQVQRQLLMAKAIKIEGYDVTVLCRYGIHKREDKVEPEGTFEGIRYIYCSGVTERPDNYLRRNYLKFLGLFNEFSYYRRFSKEKRLKGALVSTNSFYNIVFYYLMGKIFSIPTVVDNVEYWTSDKSLRGLDRIDKFLYDKFYFIFANKIICISDFLINKVRGSKGESITKIPSITDFDKFDLPDKSRLVLPEYVLFCGSVSYFEVIEFVIKSFERLNMNNILLLLVTQMNEKLKRRIDESIVRERILVKSNIPYENLVNLYLNSAALIIPMRNNDQDKARFPHKISEYCAARRPIVTSNIGEIGNYFNDSNAYLCMHYDEDEFADAIRRILSFPDEADAIAGNSYQTGKVHFNYRSYSKSLVKLFAGT